MEKVENQLQCLGKRTDVVEDKALGGGALLPGQADAAEIGLLARGHGPAARVDFGWNTPVGFFLRA